MDFSPEEVLRRFHAALVREIQDSRPEYLTSPFTVAEIYQNLVPYRTHRDVIGAEMMADYEDALLRLLAGEGDYLTIESRTARQEIREELSSPNPNTGLYREFAAAAVRLNPERIDEALGWEGGGSLPEVPGDGGEEMGPEVEPVTALSGEDTGVEVEVEGETVEEPSGAGVPVEEVPTSREEEEEVGAVETGESAGEPPETCPWCREALPRRPDVRFCPFCGSDVRLTPCPECGAELESSWRFCVSCGTEVVS